MQNNDSKKPGKNNGPDFHHERALIAAGHENICGVDEAGRGPLAGPVVVSALVLDPKNIPPGLNDSKKLSVQKREILFAQIIASASVSIVSAPPHIIADLNIRGATLWAMAQAVTSLYPKPAIALIDGRDIPKDLPCSGQALVKGDARSLSIAAASIVAKVMRDRMCLTMDEAAPGFGFKDHKGYGTARHLAALKKLGPSQYHRQYFAPVAALLNI
ncbi:Ribonuclease HII [hydrothermal vent metagenome]|uniref:Ribonuclease HII n=1 Tax=hydrothermal vent metagenome TaxID=652676 RepID=A0A3B0TE20_9ZZZZ